MKSQSHEKIETWRRFAVVLFRAIDSDLVQADQEQYAGVCAEFTIPEAALLWAIIVNGLQDSFASATKYNAGDIDQAREFFRNPPCNGINFISLGIEIEYMQSVMKKAKWWDAPRIDPANIRENEKRTRSPHTHDAAAKIIDFISAEGWCAVCDIAKNTKIHPSTIRTHLRNMCKSGLVMINQPVRRARAMYRLNGDAAL